MKNQGLFSIANKDKKFFGVRIIKLNGEINEIDLENEKVKISDSGASQDEFKIAIANLEPGDVIDYYFCTIDSWETSATVFDPFETTLNNEYPIMDFSYKIKLGNDFFINHNSYNGAPKLTDITPPDSKQKEYSLVGKNIEKRKVSRWVYPLVEYPSFKYQIAFARTKKKKNEVFAFLSENDGFIKSSVTSNDVLRAYKNDYGLEYSRKAIKNYVKDKELSKNDLVEQVYYFMRHTYLNKYIESAVAYEENLTEPTLVYNNPLVINNKKRFLLYFGTFLKDNKISFEFIKAKRRYNGSIDDLLIKKNLTSIIKVNLDKPIYLYPFKSNTFANWIPSTIEGTEAYTLKFSDKYKEIEKVEKVNLPSSNYKNNNTSELSKVSFDDEFSTITINRKSSLIGHNKVNEMGDRIYFFDYINSEYEKYNTTPYATLLDKKNKKRYDKEFPAYQEKMSKKRLKNLEKSTQNEYDFNIDDYKYEVVSTGRYSINDSLIYKEDFIIKSDLIKKAGPNHIIEIGKLIGSQVAIDKKEKERTENIYMPYPRSFNNEINVTIPEGYTVSGIEKLNLKIENETGGFISEATLEGNVLNINTYKYYANNYEPNANWPKMLEFLEAAYQFSQQKILLKK